MRRGNIKYLCKLCGHWFQIKRTRIKPPLFRFLFSHLRGTSFRSLGETYDIDPSTAYRRALKALQELPHNADITRRFCTRFCGILVVDGKYIKVKGYERKIPVLYGIDYLTHDIPTYILSESESYQTCHTFFTSLRLMQYPLKVVVSDDNANIYDGAESVYPRVLSQICHNHYKETIRQNLHVRTDPTYQPFIRDIEELFVKRRSESEFNSIAGKLFHKYKDESLCLSVLLDIQKRLPQLTAYMGEKNIPRTTNLIESYNSHLEGRLKTIKGFESFKHADLWLNGYFLNRRLKPFTDCTKQFKRLNGTASLEHSVTQRSSFEYLSRLFR